MQKTKQLHPLSIRLKNDIARVWMAELFPSTHAGATTLISCNMRLYRLTMAEIRGRFDQEELQALIDIIPNLSEGEHQIGTDLVQFIEDAVSVGLLDGRLTSPGLLLAKMQRLTCYQATVLLWWAMAYWHSQKKGKIQDPEKYIQYLLVEKQE